MLIVWGGSVGWLYHRTRPPVYEAEAVFYVSIDFTQTGELTQFEEDHAVSGIAALVYSDSVLERVIATAEARQIQIDRSSLLANSGLERKQAEWTLWVRDRDPPVAVALTDIWADQTLAALSEAHRNALEAQALMSYVQFLQSCLQPTTPPDHIQRQCNELDTATLPQEIEKNAAKLQEQLTASRGIFPALVFDLAEHALVPQQPVQYGRNSMVFAGAIVGFLIGIWAVGAKLPSRLARRRRHD